MTRRPAIRPTLTPAGALADPPRGVDASRAPRGNDCIACGERPAARLDLVCPDCAQATQDATIHGELAA